MQHGLLSLMAAREVIGHELYHQAPPYKNPPLPSHQVSELLTPSSYSEALTDDIPISGFRPWRKNMVAWRTLVLSVRFINQTT